MRRKSFAVGLLLVILPIFCLGLVNAPDPGAWALLETQTASSSATIDFASLPTAYRDFKIVGSSVVPATDNTRLMIRISVASTFKSGAADYAWSNYFHTPTSSGQLGDVSDSEINLFNATGSEAGEEVSFEVILYDPADTALRKPILGTSGGQSSSGTYTSRSVAGYYIAATSAIDGIRFLFATGNIESGTFTLYGRMN